MLSIVQLLSGPLDSLGLYYKKQWRLFIRPAQSLGRLFLLFLVSPLLFTFSFF